VAAAERRIPVVVDGFIASSAVLAAVRAQPVLREYLLFATRSSEPAHALVLQALGCEQPIFDLGLRLGEGSGAALVLPIVQASLAVLEEMATFGEAGVTDAGR